MKCETDIKRVRKLAARKEKANWEFRTFLKGVELSIEEWMALFIDTMTRYGRKLIVAVAEIVVARLPQACQSQI